MIYLDNNATTPMAPEVVRVMAEALSECWGNPSSIHTIGQKARQRLTAARRTIASLLGCSLSEILFTSGGSEALNLAITGLLPAAPGQIITSSVEHAAVAKPLEQLEKAGWRVERLPVGIEGMVTPEAITNALTSDTRMLVLMAANNETGALLPLEEIAALAEQRGILLVVDGVVLPGKECITLPKGVSAAAFSAHKFHGPKGAGFLYLRKGIRCKGQILGGPQESGRRAGTENVPALLGMAEALRLVTEDLSVVSKEMARLRDRFEEALCARCAAEVNGAGRRVCNTSNLFFPGVDGESLLMQLDLKGVAASHGSACSSGALEPSRVLLSMGYAQERAMQSLRFSLSRYTTEAEIDRAVDIIAEVAQRLSTMGGDGDRLGAGERGLTHSQA